MCAWVHAASISGASRRRRRQSVAAPPSAPAITPPALTPFARFSRSPSVPLPLLLSLSALLVRLSIEISLSFSLSPTSLSLSIYNSLSFRLRRRCYRHCSLFLAFSTGAPEICENLQGAISPSFSFLSLSLSASSLVLFLFLQLSLLPFLPASFPGNPRDLSRSFVAARPYARKRENAATRTSFVRRA